MARIAFVQNLAFEYMGVMFIASVLKRKGHSVEIFISRDIQKTIKDIKGYGADLVGFTCITGNQNWCLKAAQVIKTRTQALTIFGGPHATFFPEIIKEQPVDIVCRGEAEMVLLELADKLDSKLDITRVPNCWFKKDGMVISNELTKLLEDLDDLPFPDRGVYYNKYPFLNRSQKMFIGGRGCPFKCSYCFNESMQILYMDKGRYVRYRSVDNVLEEIKYVYEKYSMHTVYMVDDTFILNKPWVNEFLDRYTKEINLPLICLARADLLTEETVRKLKKANCYSVFFGIESGNEQLRKQILNRHISNEQIIRAARLLKRHGIKFRTYNMVGIPEETVSDALLTVKMNIRIDTDYPWCSILQPYPKTKIEDYARSKNLLGQDSLSISSSFFRGSVINSKYKSELENLQKLFFFAAKSYLPLSVLKIIIRFPPNCFFNLAFLVSYAYCYRKSENLGLMEFSKIGLRNLGAILD